MSSDAKSDEPKRLVCYVPIDGFVPGHGYRVSFVTEGEAGHTPTGTWPYTSGGTLPWFWGPTLKDAQEEAERQNEKMGISKREAFEIITASMAMQKSTRTPKHAKRRR